ncbi:MAG TPA: hypothetical protein DDW50_14210 [Firmicutes bacterium]|nr:hypothetical protein [Bacillota bacterium]
MKYLKKDIFLLFSLLLLSMAVASQTEAINNSVPANFKEYTQLEMGDILFDTPKAPKQKLLKSKIFFRGKLLKSPLLKNDEAVVYRMVITCCTADALPLGILVKLPSNIQFHDGDWVGIAGTLELLPFNDRLKTIDPLANMVPPEKVFPYFTATKAYKINAPKDEYIYVQYNY